MLRSEYWKQPFQFPAIFFVGNACRLHNGKYTLLYFVQMTVLSLRDLNAFMSHCWSRVTSHKDRDFSIDHQAGEMCDGGLKEEKKKEKKIV